jgi:integrase
MTVSGNDRFGSRADVECSFKESHSIDQLMAFRNALRISEVADLRVSDVNLDVGRIYTQIARDFVG